MRQTSTVEGGLVQYRLPATRAERRKMFIFQAKAWEIEEKLSQVEFEPTTI